MSLVSMVVKLFVHFSLKLCILLKDVIVFYVPEIVCLCKTNSTFAMRDGGFFTGHSNGISITSIT